MADDMVRLAALADLHCGKDGQGAFRELFAQASAAAEIIVVCGDLTDYGLPEEAQVLARELQGAKAPVLAVLGNHDFHSGKQAEVRQILEDAGMRVLDGEVCEIEGVGFAGVKGFMGGFGRRMLEPWGEPIVKQIVHESVEEAVKLESALARLPTAPRVALLHFAPIQDTVEGEPPEIFAFMGCGRLEDPLNRHRVAAALHGHAHHGRLEGKTSQGVPVYNVSMPILHAHYPDRPPFRVIEVPRTATKSAAP
jgi:Icc-related predicted phosphoesterase